MVFLLIASFPDSILNFRGDLVRALINKGKEVHVASPDVPVGSQKRKNIEALGCIVHNIPMSRVGLNPFHDFKTLWALWKLMRSVKPRFVLAYTVKPVIYGLICARLSGVAYRFALITGLGYSFQEPTKRLSPRILLTKLVQNLYSFSLRGCCCVFFQNTDDEDLFRERRLIDTSVKSVVVNGSGVDTSYYATTPLPSQIKFLLIARLLGSKGVREYVEAARQIKAQYPDTIFAVAGWIDENPDAISLIELESWINEGLICYLGRLSDVRPAIADCSVYVLPSYREGTPRTVLEALAMGRPIITTDAPGCRETVVHGKNGFLVKVKDAEEIVKAMKAFIDQPSLIGVMGEASRSLAERKYDVHTVNGQMLAGMGIDQ